MSTSGIVLDCRNLGDLYDDSRYHHTLTPTACVPVRGHAGRGIKFNGTTSSIDAGASSALQNSTSKSVFAWIKPSAFIAAYRVICAAGFWTSPYGDIAYCNNGSNGITIALKNTLGSDIGLAITFTPDKWIHVGYTWDGANAYAYKNGLQVDTGAMSGTLACTSTNLFIGSRDGTQDFYDSIASAITIYNYALDADDIRRNYLSKAYLYQEHPVRIP